MRASLLSFILFAAVGTALPQIRVDDQCGNIRIAWSDARCPTGYYCQYFNDWYSACVALTLSSILNPPSSTGGLGPITRTDIGAPAPTLDSITITQGETIAPTPPVLEGRQVIRVDDPCGGIGWTSDTTCSAGYYCQYYNDWFSGCMPLSYSSILSRSSTGGLGSITRSAVDTAPPTPTATRGEIIEAAPTLLADRQIRIDDTCGGAGWAGANNCPAGSYCQFINQWYSRCLPVSLSSIFNPPTSTDGLGSVTRSIIETATDGDIAATRAVPQSVDPTPTPLKGRQTLVEYTCGGMGYTGSTACPSGMYCYYYNAWYSQCLPGSKSSSSSVQSTISVPTAVASSMAAIATLITTTTASS